MGALFFWLLLLAALGIAKMLTAASGRPGQVGCLAFLAGLGFLYWAFAMGSTALVVFVLVTGLVGSMFFGLSSTTTLRPLNECSACGYTWYPRGKDYSPRCPSCRRSRGVAS